MEKPHPPDSGLLLESLFCDTLTPRLVRCVVGVVG